MTKDVSMEKHGASLGNVSPIRAEIHHRPTKPPSGGWRPIRPRKPDWLDEYGSRVWDRTVAELEPLGILNPSHRELLAAYCEVASVNFAAWKELTPNKERGPEVLVAGRDQRDEHVRSKAWGILRESAALLDKLSKSLVLSPSALMRAELPYFDNEDESDLD